LRIGGEQIFCLDRILIIVGGGEQLGRHAPSPEQVSVARGQLAIGAGFKKLVDEWRGLFRPVGTLIQRAQIEGGPIALSAL